METCRTLVGLCIRWRASRDRGRYKDLMAYTIMTGQGEGAFDSAFETSSDTLKMARELVRQGRSKVRVVDADGRRYSVAAFEHLIERGEGSVG